MSKTQHDFKLVLQRGFTLIELSIVLVIIGLITGAVLVGQDLVSAAAIRAQITQIEKYQTAVNTFRGKYDDQLPGDMDYQHASMFGFTARPNSASAGQGDGNGVIQGQGGCGYCQVLGETTVFWSDLSSANLIDGKFTTAKESGTAYSFISGTNVGLYFPAAKLTTGSYGGINSVYVYSGGISQTDQNNYFGISSVQNIWSGSGFINSTPSLTVQQAYMIDTKVDDGLPQSGKVTAVYLAPWPPLYVVWAKGISNAVIANSPPGADPGTAASQTIYTCYDNGGHSANLMQYSIGQTGTGLNCALSFQFQ